MSRTTDVEIKSSPCKKYLKWAHVKTTKLDDDGEEVKVYKGSQFVYWDKELEKEVPVEFPLKFAVLEKDTFNFKGYSNIEKAYLYTNEVRRRWDGTKHNEDDLNLDITVRNSKTKDVIVEPFKVKDISKLKTVLDGHDLKKVESIYIAVKIGDNWEIWNLQLTKSQLSGGRGKDHPKNEPRGGWWEFVKLAAKGNKIYKNFVEIPKFEVRKSNMGKFGVPIFEIGDELSKADMAVIDGLDKELQEYLSYYMSKPKESAAEPDESYPADWDEVGTTGEGSGSWDDVTD